MLTHRRILTKRPRLTLALVPSLGTTSRIWDGVLAALASTSEMDVVLVELPGHGGAAPTSLTTVESLAEDLLEVLSVRRTRTSVIAGVSMGGAVALEAAARGTDHVVGVAMANSAFRFGDAQVWARMIAEVERTGTAAPHPERTAAGWFTRSFREGHGAPIVADTLRDLDVVDPGSYIACCRALAHYDGNETLRGLAVPLLTIGGAKDLALPPHDLRRAADDYDFVRYDELAAGHLAITEDPHAAALLLDRFLRELRPPRIDPSPESGGVDRN